MFRSMADVKQANRAAGLHFFDADTLRFFGSKVSGELVGGCFFVTSEKQPNFFNYRTGEMETYPRLYTVRRANDDGSIGTVGEFQQHATMAAAKRAAMLAANAETVADLAR